ncbi:MAG: tetratricopeptide repeat protein [Bacteroidota bacterium]|nr:tetratricopeptide repeat protein [Bacteroidota bacterium]
MKKLTSLLTLTLLSNLTFGQTYYDNFKKLFKENDTSKIKTLLSEWEKSNPNDPEFYTSAFNYYFSNSKQEILSLQTATPKNDGFQLRDSSGNVAGFLTSNLNYNQEKLKKAMFYINKGIEKFPNRLDIRFGKCYVLGQIEDYTNFTKSIIETVEYSKVNKNQWLWTENKPKEDAEKFMLETVHTYLRQLYETEDDSLLNNMIQIGVITLKYYPKSIEILSTTSVALMLLENYDKAIQYLKQAEQLNPKDFIVLSNIAQGYKLKGDKENAIKYYELTLKHGDEQAKKYAQTQIEKLKKN